MMPANDGARVRHRAVHVSADGCSISSLCFSKVRLIDSRRASWTFTDTGVTCSKCLRILKRRRQENDSRRYAVDVASGKTSDRVMVRASTVLTPYRAAVHALRELHKLGSFRVSVISPLVSVYFDMERHLDENGQERITWRLA